jgi:hypothetical protein
MGIKEMPTNSDIVGRFVGTFLFSYLFYPHKTKGKWGSLNDD